MTQLRKYLLSLVAAIALVPSVFGETKVSEKELRNSHIVKAALDMLYGTKNDEYVLSIQALGPNEPSDYLLLMFDGKQQAEARFYWRGDRLACLRRRCACNA